MYQEIPFVMYRSRHYLCQPPCVLKLLCIERALTSKHCYGTHENTG